MPKKTDSPDVTEETEVVTTTETPTQPDETNWEDRFKGLQRTFDRRQKEYTKLQEQYDAILEQVETAKQDDRAKQTELEILQKAMEESKTKLDKLTGELTAQEARSKRATLIMSQFPDLAKFEASGLLPAAETEEDLIEKLGNFREALKTTVETNVQQKIVGASPDDTGSTSTVPVLSASEIYSRLTALAGRRDQASRDEYQQLLEQWDRLQNKKTE